MPHDHHSRYWPIVPDEVDALIDNKKRLMPKDAFRLYLLSVPAPVFYYISYFVSIALVYGT
eukprot:SAG31_NODE_6647_length_1939_cov_14.997826_3_plen_61_part_00